MKLTFFTGGLSGGGAERVICNLANFLIVRNHECTILTMLEEEASYDLDKRIKVVSLIKKSERKNVVYDNILRIIRLKKYLKTSDSEAYIGFLPRTIIMLLALRKNTKARVVVSERADPTQYLKITQFLLKKLAKRADQWVFQTADAMAWYKGYIKNGIIIPNAINPAFIKAPYEGERRKVIVGAGRLIKQKNFALLIDAFADIADEFPDYTLTIYGEGNKRSELEQLAKEHDIGDRVSLPGYVMSLGDEIEDASLFVLSSDFEGMPNALMEAMALGLPCISTDCPVGGPRYLIRDGKNGVVVPVNDRFSLAEAIRNMLSNKEKSVTMGREAAKISDELHPDKIYTMWSNVIQA